MPGILCVWPVPMCTYSVADRSSCIAIVSSHGHLKPHPSKFLCALNSSRQIGIYIPKSLLRCEKFRCDSGASQVCVGPLNRRLFKIFVVFKTVLFVDLQKKI